MCTLKETKSLSHQKSNIKDIITCIHVEFQEENYCDAFGQEFILCSKCLQLLDNFLLFIEY